MNALVFLRKKTNMETKSVFRLNMSSEKHALHIQCADLACFRLHACLNADDAQTRAAGELFGGFKHEVMAAPEWLGSGR